MWSLLALAAPDEVPTYSVQLMTGALNPSPKGVVVDQGRPPPNSVVMTKRGGKRYRCHLPADPSAAARLQRRLRAGHRVRQQRQQRRRQQRCPELHRGRARVSRKLSGGSIWSQAGPGPHLRLARTAPSVATSARTQRWWCWTLLRWPGTPRVESPLALPAPQRLLHAISGAHTDNMADAQRRCARSHGPSPMNRLRERSPGRCAKGESFIAGVTTNLLIFLKMP